MTKKIKSITVKKDYKFSLWDMSLEDLIKKNPEAFEIEYESEKYAVHTPTQADFDELMRLYEIAGWERARYDFGQDTAVDIGQYGHFASLEYQKSRGHTILTLAEARQKLQEMFPDKDFSEKPKQTFFDNGSCVLPLEIKQGYWFIDDCDDVCHQYWHNEYFDQYRLESQNVFLTKEAAENAKDVQDTHNRILVEVKKIDAKKRVELEPDDNKFYVFDFIKGKKSWSMSTGYVPKSKCKTPQARDYIMQLSDNDFKKFCLIHK